MTWCPHDDDPNSCPPCNGAGRPRRVSRPVAAATMLARYSSRCRACDTAIRADIDTVTLIRDVNDEWWIHATCAVAAELGA